MAPPDPVGDFYDALCSSYHLLFEDWPAAVRRQGEVLERVIARLAGPGRKRILDASCGIGTQAIGLALRGHAVAGSDISAAAIERARSEAAARGVALDLRVADLRDLAAVWQPGFDLVVALDNSLPHLLEEADLDAALRGMAALLARDGWLLVSLRDYDRLAETRPAATPPRVIGSGVERRVVFQDDVQNVSQI